MGNNNIGAINQRIESKEQRKKAKKICARAKAVADLKEVWNAIPAIV